MQEIIHFIIETASDWGYLGIIILMTLESCFIPFPSEVVMIPAGYLAHKGELDIVFCILSGVLGSVLGALINYYICFFGVKNLYLDGVNILVSMKLNLPDLKNFLINTENFPLLLVGFCQEFVSIFPCLRVWLK